MVTFVCAKPWVFQPQTCDPPRPTQGGSPEPFGPGTPEESEKSPERVQGPKSAQGVRPGVSKESEKSLQPDFRTLFGLFSFETPGRTLWALLVPCPRGTLSGLFSDSSGVLGPKGPGDPVWGGADRNHRPTLPNQRPFSARQLGVGLRFGKPRTWEIAPPKTATPILHRCDGKGWGHKRGDLKTP